MKCNTISFSVSKPEQMVLYASNLIWFCLLSHHQQILGALGPQEPCMLMSSDCSHVFALDHELLSYTSFSSLCSDMGSSRFNLSNDCCSKSTIVFVFLCFLGKVEFLSIFEPYKSFAPCGEPWYFNGSEIMCQLIFLTQLNKLLMFLPQLFLPAFVLVWKPQRDMFHFY